MPKFAFIFTLFVASLSLPIALTWTEGNQPVMLTELDTETEEVIPTPTQNTPTPINRPPLLDIQGHFAESAIQSLYEKGIVNGYANGSFGPNDPITRGQLLQITLAAFPETEPTITDEDKTATRGEALKIMVEAAGFTGLTDATETTGENFADVDGIRDWFAKYAAFAKKAGLVNGINGNFNGNQTISRGEACLILQKLIDYVNGEE